MARKESSKPADSTAHLGFEAKLWLAVDKLRNNMDAAEYKHVVLGLIRKNGPWTLVWSEPQPNRAVAMAREKQITSRKSARTIRTSFLGLPE